MKLHDEKGPTILGLLFYFFAITILGISIIFAARAEARERLNLKFMVEIQYRLGDTSPWEQSKAVSIDGIGGLQFHLDPQAQYRMLLKVKKPFDLAGAFRVRMVSRVDGVSVPKGTDEGTIIFGPHTGCQGFRCEPLSLADVGQVELRLDLEKADQTAIGIFNFRPFDEAPPIVIRTRYFHGDKEIHCGTFVKKGWWIFAKKLRADGSQVDTISACVRKPSGKTTCSDDGEYQVKTRANETGAFQFSLWNTKAIEDSCFFYTK